jgi:hypothetical protein
MTPVDQEFEHDPPRQNGDCLRAVTASILDLPRSEVPHFSADDSDEHWFFRWSPWLYARGISLVPIYGAHIVDAYHVAVGLSPRGARHAVVMRNGRTVHDPHPSRVGILAMDQGFLFVPLRDVLRSLGKSSERHPDEGS